MGHTELVIVRFGACEVDFDRVEIRRDGELVRVEPQVFDVLSYLIEHRDRMITKEELLDNIWGDRFVSESALTSRIKSARQAIGDSGRDQAMIKTSHGKGYRFIAATEQVEEATPPTASVPAEPAPTGDTVQVHRQPGDVDVPELDGQWPLVGRHDEVEQIGQAFRERRLGGVMITGPAGVGKTRLARECVARIAAGGAPIVRVSGHAESSDVPLGAISHLLPADVLSSASAAGELARTIVFQRARTVFDELGGGDRAVLLIDNVGQLDDLTCALLGSLLTTGSVFAIMTQRTDHHDGFVLHELVRSGQIAHVDLGPLDDTDLDVLLYRVLSGPIDLQSLEHLTRLARGRPGALQQLVETCRSSGALSTQNGVWRLTGPVQAMIGPPGERATLDNLDPAVHAGAEILAIAGDLDLELATDLLGADVLDDLDRAGLLTLDESAHAPRLSLAHGHVALVLLENTGPLRLRRHKARLVDALGQAADRLPAFDHLRRVRWAIEIGLDAERDDVIAAAAGAVAAADAAAADILLDHLDRVAPGPDATRLRAELRFRLGQMAHAEQLLDELLATELDDDMAAAVRRRRATITFHVRAQYNEALDLLTGDDAPDHPQLRVHAVGLRGFLGQANRIDELVAALPDDLDPTMRLEVLRGQAQAAVARGQFDRGLALVDEHDRLIAGQDPAAAQAALETSLATRIDALIGRGETDRAIEVARAALPPGQRTMLAWLPLAITRALLNAGQARAARNMIRTPLAAVRNQNLLHAEPLMVGMLVESSLQLGDHADAQTKFAFCEQQLPLLVGHLQWQLAASMARAMHIVGDRDRAISIATGVADDAEREGATAVAAILLAIAAVAGDAAALTARLDTLVDGIDGPLWPIIARHVHTLAGGADQEVLREIAGDYRRLGNERLAGAAESAVTS
jgi:DNA-binding winged helix-turn-helix (wHTH) protein